ncbi:MAG TPA: dTMP kinase, partial [Verrucomicrobiae bacterium]|nr:dTMP kinase [Verrucomicrobiae bacterium]
RGLDLKLVKAVIDFAVGETRPAITLLFQVPLAVREARLASRQATLPFMRDRIEEGDPVFFERVRKGYQVIAQEEPKRVQAIDASGTVEAVSAEVWKRIEPLLPQRG